MHYARLKRHGDPRNVVYPKSLLLRILQQTKITKGCWFWVGAKDTAGYAHLGTGMRMVRVHRLIYQLFKGPIINGNHILHTCDNRNCLRPKHLWQGTNKDNVDDKIAKNRQSRGSAIGISKLTEEKVLEIRHKRSCGAKCTDLAIEYNVHPSGISNIVNRRYWKHI